MNVSDENDKYSGDTADLTKTVTYKKVSESKSYVSGSDADTKTYTKIQMIRIPVTERHTQNVMMENIMLREKQRTQKMV